MKVETINNVYENIDKIVPEKINGYLYFKLEGKKFGFTYVSVVSLKSVS